MTASINVFQVKDPYSAWTHAAGALLAMAGIAPLIVQSRGEPMRVVSFSIYGATLVLLFVASCLYHSIRAHPRVEETLFAIDRGAIHGLIAGTYTPLCLVALPKAWGWSLLGVAWGLAAAGVTLDLVTKRKMPDRLQALLYLVCGWVFVVAIVPVVKSLSVECLWWLGAGQLLYTAGAALCVHHPACTPGRFNCHDLWHAVVVAAGACHYRFMWLLAQS
jgi:hemolysin III